MDISSSQLTQVRPRNNMQAFSLRLAFPRVHHVPVCNSKSCSSAYRQRKFQLLFLQPLLVLQISFLLPRLCLLPLHFPSNRYPSTFSFHPFTYFPFYNDPSNFSFCNFTHFSSYEYPSSFCFYPFTHSSSQKYPPSFRSYHFSHFRSYVLRYLLKLLVG